ncbi:MAG: hypothetical protein QXR18_06640, partial [Pyrobaculum sp.]
KKKTHLKVFRPKLPSQHVIWPQNAMLTAKRLFSITSKTSTFNAEGQSPLSKAKRAGLWRIKFQYTVFGLLTLDMVKAVKAAQYRKPGKTGWQKTNTSPSAS